MFFGNLVEEVSLLHSVSAAKAGADTLHPPVARARDLRISPRCRSDRSLEFVLTPSAHRLSFDANGYFLQRIALPDDVSP